MLISQITKTTLAASALVLLSSTAHAGNCGGSSLYCNSGGHGHSSSSHSDGYSATLPTTYSHSSSYSSSSVSDSYADAKYGSGSISESWSDGNTSYVPFSSPGSSVTSSSISGYSVPGLGANERLCPTACNDNIGVYGAGNARVLGCYKVCKPAVTYTYTPRPVVQQNFVRVVRPIIYVRYPVVMRPACSTYVTTHYSRYGGYPAPRRCGW